MCAAVEYPLHVEHDEMFLGSGLQSAIDKLVKEGILGRHPSNGPADKSWHYIGQEVQSIYEHYFTFTFVSSE